MLKNSSRLEETGFRVLVHPKRKGIPFFLFKVNDTGNRPYENGDW